MSKIILDLCGGTGSWSRPYIEAGYDVQLITLPEYDIKTYIPPLNVYGILAAPPCTEFSLSGARYWKAKPPHLLEDALQVVRKCLEIVDQCQPTFWALENPKGRLQNYIGNAKYQFQPYFYGDEYSKLTWLWGNFNMPVPTHFEPKALYTLDQWIEYMYPGMADCERRAITPRGFANAFFQANP